MSQPGAPPPYGDPIDPNAQSQWPYPQSYGQQPPPPYGQVPPPYGQPPYGYPQPGPGTNGLAIASLILAFLCSLAGLICGIVALNQLAERPNEGGRGLAIAGIIVSAVSIVGSIAWYVAVT
ncbi:MAG TPA: DUF4190 domain-containing protein [Jatrophihabitans sp.]|jgi:hypothetical protein|nr:DUF4190 domain-containing protein [Jatrophihabitans sp.]